MDYDKAFILQRKLDQSITLMYLNHDGIIINTKRITNDSDQH
ncbi:unnamed protein product, partial [Rotaria socialis]